MPLVETQLQAGDILFKHAPQKAVAKIIRKKQMGIRARVARESNLVGSALAADRTHVAMAAGPNDVLEFDEGGSGIKLLARGYGFVRGNMTVGARPGSTYDVFGCTSAPIAAAATEKAELIWDLTHQSQNLKGSYGLGKLVRQLAPNPSKGKSYDYQSLEERLEDWSQKKRSIKFICSEFVAFCYIWAADESPMSDWGGVQFLLGTAKARISPVELYTRVETQGKPYFRFKGTMYA